MTTALKVAVPVVVGNLGIVLSLAWLGPSELGLNGLIFVGLVSLLLYNSCLFVGRKVFGSRTRAGEQAIPVSPRRLSPVHKAIPGALAVVGLMFAIGAILPNRLPRDQRNMGRESIYWVVAAGFVYGAVYSDRKRRR